MLTTPCYCTFIWGSPCFVVMTFTGPESMQLFGIFRALRLKAGAPRQSIRSLSKNNRRCRCVFVLEIATTLETKPMMVRASRLASNSINSRRKSQFEVKEYRQESKKRIDCAKERKEDCTHHPQINESYSWTIAPQTSQLSPSRIVAKHNTTQDGRH